MFDVRVFNPLCSRVTQLTRLHARGFSLVELLIALAIIAILASIAIPTYRNYVTRSNRSEAQQLMTTIANREAQYLLDAREYTDVIGSAGLNITNLNGWSCEDSCTNDHYTVSVEVGESPADGFTITATPAGRQVRDGTLKLESSGSRSRIISGVDQGW